MNFNKDLEYKFKFGVKYILEATDFESRALWEEHKANIDNFGILYNVGLIGDNPCMPVYIALNICEINGMKYLQWNAISRYSDYRMIDDWLEYHFKGIKKTDATNYHNLVSESLKLKKGVV